jgi:hypothetical protein
MANRRMLDGAFWEDRKVQSRLSLAARYLFIGLISNADDEGRVCADPVWLKSRIFLYDAITVDEVRTALEEIAATCPSVHLYESDGDPYIAFLKWSTYQSIKNARPSAIPAPSVSSTPAKGKPGPKPKNPAFQADKETFGSNSPANPLPLSDDELPANGNRIDEKLVTREIEVEIEEKRRREEPPSVGAAIAAPPGISPTGEKPPDPEAEPSKRPGADLFREVFGRFPRREFFHRFDAAIAGKGEALVKRRLEEWRDNPACSPTNYADMLDVAVNGWKADRARASPAPKAKAEASGLSFLDEPEFRGRLVN